MDNAMALVFGTIVAIAGLLGLYLAAHALDDGIYLFGLLLAAFAVVFDFWLVKRHFDAAEAEV
jgi:ABC-type maltose transport system permease subunit